MSVLDRPELCAALDSKSMRNLMQSLPAQIEGAAQVARSLPLTPSGRVSHVVVFGMGGSAISGDVIRAATAETLRVPFVVCREYRLPAFVDSSTVAFASSYSGNTEETLSAYEQARAAGANIVCLTSGGKLASLGHSHGYPVIQVPAGMPPRAAIGYLSVLLLGALTALGLAPEASESLRETADVLNGLVPRLLPEVPESKNPAKQMAGALHGRLAAIYAGPILEPAAARWRGQIEENAKNLAFHHVLPEMNHNELVGWELPPSALHQVGAVFLRDGGDHPQVQRRFDLTKEIVSRQAGAVHEAWSEGRSVLARLFSVICLGDFVSLFLSYLNEVDPTPVPVIETLKRQLAG
jgi:glucose/mannose-6-phosphate isomerase